MRVFEHTIHELNRRVVSRMDSMSDGITSEVKANSFPAEKIWWRYATTTAHAHHTAQRTTQVPKNSRTSRAIRIFWRENILFFFCSLQMYSNWLYMGFWLIVQRDWPMKSERSTVGSTLLFKMPSPHNAIDVRFTSITIIMATQQLNVSCWSIAFNFS